MTALTKTQEFAISKTGKTVMAIAGIVALELLLVYALIPVGVNLWRVFTCPC
jgi:hypothetical protein